MDKSAIRNFSIEARKILMKSAETEAGFYGVTRKGCKNPIQKGNDFEVYETLAGTENRIYGAEIKKRANLVEAVETLGFDQVIEETAYTWFNRIIAIRFMEVNRYLPTRVRVLSSESGSNTPDIVTQSLDVDLNITPEELEKVQKAKDENRYDDAFRMLFVKQCNELNAILPGLFEKTDDYMELLLKLSYTSDGVVRMLIDTVAEDNFNVETVGQVEIIGWMYQYYNTELNELVYDGNMAKGKINKELIPAATQLFTPDWPIKYMVDNSLGKILKETSEDNFILDDLKYYIQEQDDFNAFENKDVEHIKFLDPCMGSGHILVYAFDVYMKMYECKGYLQRDAATLILKNNLFGFDIDYRAYQMAYFAIFMKARFYNKRIFNEVESLNLFYFKDSSQDWKAYVDIIVHDNNIDVKVDLNKLIDMFEYSTTIGSALIVPDDLDVYTLKKYITNEDAFGQLSLEGIYVKEIKRNLLRLINQVEVLKTRFDVIVTNPPYLGDTRYNAVLSNYINKYYSDVKTDLSMVMLKKCYHDWVKKDGVVAFITPTSWLSLKSFESFRVEIIKNYWISSLVDFGTELFDGKIGHNPITAWVICNRRVDKKTVSVRLVDFCYSQKYKKEHEFFNKENYFFSIQREFLDIPGQPIAYWLSEAMCQTFKTSKLLGDLAFPRQGLATADNDRFLRLWWEIGKKNIGFNIKSSDECIDSQKKWFPYNKGGVYRKWYGNRWYVINWKDDGKEIRKFNKSVVRNPDFYFKNSIGYSDVTSGDFSIRKYGNGFVFDSTGPSFFISDASEEKYIMAVMNSVVAKAILKIFCPSLHFTQSAVAKVPIIFDESKKDRIVELVNECIDIVKKDWDYREISWDFSEDLFIKFKNGSSSIEEIWNKIKSNNVNQRLKLKNNEEEINKILIKTYNLDELDYRVDEESLSIEKPNFQCYIFRFISYVVGVLMGRYGNYDDVESILLISEDNYSDNDIVEKFIKYIAFEFGEVNLEDNMNFICSMIDNDGVGFKEKLRLYFLKDFFPYHCKMYSTVNSGKRPIYWQFDSGKENGFKCLVYIHKYTKDCLNVIRTDYFRKMEDSVENALKNVEYIIQSSSSAVECAKATKKRDKYVKQLNEMHIFYQALSHLAIQKVEVNLDDGVKKNYQLFQDIEVIIDGGKKQKVNLLTKI